ncbi:c-type cytochrome [Deminuibacter soli]|uniref:Cytochrome c n=1 Tax=Deminuibacter soli TaxID=2291815 RepID=A0A3E1NRD0_9BACT|nr:cytochrome c [Deminuibacter soli]RFM30374.1 cytochrome c [Deminuibacter soli]
MKKISIIIAVFAAGIALVSCGDGLKRKPGTVYMPDMGDSRAYETYADHSILEKKGIFYNNKPVAGTIARGEEMPFLLTKDLPGDTANYVASKQVANPVTSLNAKETAEAERLYLVNCGICHGAKLDGNGPLYKDGKGPFPAKPATLVGDAKYEAMPDGQMFYSVTYGKNLMGSYASQLSRKQRWAVIHYIKSKQSAGKAPSAPAAAADSSATAKK